MVDTKVLNVKIELPNTVPLTLGLTVDVKIMVLQKDNVLVVPRKAVVGQNGETSVSVQTHDTYTPRKIVLGITDGRYVEVLAGLQEGEIVSVPQ